MAKKNCVILNKDGKFLTESKKRFSAEYPDALLMTEAEAHKTFSELFPILPASCHVFKNYGNADQSDITIEPNIDEMDDSAKKAVKKGKKQKNDLASLASYISGINAGLSRKDFLSKVVEAINADIIEAGDDDDSFVSAAREKVVTGDGEFNVDDDAVVSQSDKGAYVACWVWVSNEEAGIEEDEDEEEEEEEEDNG